MGVFLDVALAATGSAAALGVIRSAAMLRRIRRSNRVVPNRPSAAPVSWRWNPSRAAMLHRRLRAACASVIPVAGPTPRTRWLRRRPAAPTSVLACAGQDLLDRALSTDAGLVEAARHGRAERRAMLRVLAQEVTEIEVAAARLTRLERRVRTGSAVDASSGVGRAEQLLDAFEAALDELGSDPPGLRTGDR